MLIYFFLITLGSVYCYLSRSLDLEGFKLNKKLKKAKKKVNKEVKSTKKSVKKVNERLSRSSEKTLLGGSSSEKTNPCEKAKKCNKNKSKGDLIKEVKRIIKRAKKYTKNFGNIFVKMSNGIAAFFEWLFKSLLCLDNLIIELFTSKIGDWFKSLPWYWKTIIVIFTLVLLFFTWIVWLPILIFYYTIYGLRYLFSYKEWKKQETRTKRCKIKYVKEQWEKVLNKFPGKNNWAMLNPAYIILGNVCMKAENECDKYKAKLEADAQAKAAAAAAAAASEAKAKAKSNIPKEKEEIEPESQNYIGIILLLITIITMSITILNLNTGDINKDQIGLQGNSTKSGVGTTTVYDSTTK